MANPLLKPPSSSSKITGEAFDLIFSRMNSLL